MQGVDKGKLRLRVGTFRVIYWYTKEIKKEIINEYEIDKDIEIEILFIDEIGNRGDIYK